MKVSIITISFNSGKTIEATIRSVLAQEDADIEYIIIDGGSKDNTLQIVEKFKHRIARVVSEKDSGIYDAMNKGVSLATGELIGILNSDDTYAYPTVIADVVQALGDADAVYADLQYVNADTGKVVRHWKSGLYRSGDFLKGWMPPHPTFFLRKKYYDQHGLYIIDQGTAADYELMLRMIHKHGITLSYLPKVITQMKTGGASNVTWNQRWKANQQDRLSWKINGLQPKWFTLLLKPLRKLMQFSLVPNR
jgi:glycosyltransferase involved in cell wall biosynthesis